jgi:ketosteroid isomerase-like protein
MLTREQILKTIDAAYTRRRQGDKSVTADLMAPGGTYALAGDASLLVGYPVGPSEAVAAVSKLIDLFTFHDDERLEAAVDGNRATVRWRVTLSRGPDGPRVATEIAQFWTFNDDGKALSLLEFADTALIAQLLKG